jgi:hypothetical protein
MTQQESVNFSYATWRSQGEAALAELISEEKTISDKLEKTKANIKKLKQALQSNGRKEIKPSGHKGKVMIKPILISLFVSNPGKIFPLEDIIDYVQEEKPNAVVSSIEMSVKRLAHSHENIVKADNGYFYKTK